MTEKVQKKRIVTNTAYTMGGALLLNGILQLLIYPLLNRIMGSESLGILLYIMGLVAILCPSVGQALNTSRLVLRRTHEVKNGDYNLLLVLFGVAGSVVALAISRGRFEGSSGYLLTFALLLMTIFRYYGDVEYRLNLNYRNYFIYYAVLSGGYILGFLLYLLSGNWFLIFITGEGLALLYLALTGTVFQSFWKRSSCFRLASLRGGFLVFSYLITNLTLNMDRLVLNYLIGNLAVTQYYVTSLIGKTLVLLIAPVNTIIISYLTRRKEQLNRKEYLGFVGIGLGVSLVFFLCAQVGTPLFVWLFYRDLYESVKTMVTVVNLSQILGLLSAYLFIVVLTFTEEKWQLILQVVHLVIMTVLVLLLTGAYGILGFAWAVLIANAIRVLAVIILGMIKVGKPGISPAD